MVKTRDGFSTNCPQKLSDKQHFVKMEVYSLLNKAENRLAAKKEDMLYDEEDNSTSRKNKHHHSKGSSPQLTTLQGNLGASDRLVS